MGNTHPSQSSEVDEVTGHCDQGSGSQLTTPLYGSVLPIHRGDNTSLRPFGLVRRASGDGLPDPYPPT